VGGILNGEGGREIDKDGNKVREGENFFSLLS
jgi:hypothetical protein